MDIRLKTLPLSFDGREYLLRCNMNVLATVQEAHGGDLLDVLQSRSTIKSVLEFTAAMVNDYAEEMDWPERYTANQIGRKLSFDKHFMSDIMKLISDAVNPEQKEDNPKN